MIYDTTNNFIHALKARLGGKITRTTMASIGFMVNNIRGDNISAAASQRHVIVNDFSWQTVSYLLQSDTPITFTLGWWQLFFDLSEGGNAFTVTGDYKSLGDNYYLVGEGAEITGATAETDLLAISDLMLFWVFDDNDGNVFVFPCENKCYFGDVNVYNWQESGRDKKSLLLLIKPDGSFEITGHFSHNVSEVFFSHIFDDNDNAFGYDFNGLELDFVPDALAALGDAVPITFTPFFLTSEEGDHLLTEDDVPLIAG